MIIIKKSLPKFQLSSTSIWGKCPPPTPYSLAALSPPHSLRGEKLGWGWRAGAGPQRAQGESRSKRVIWRVLSGSPLRWPLFPSPSLWAVPVCSDFFLMVGSPHLSPLLFPFKPSCLVSHSWRIIVKFSGFLCKGNAFCHHEETKANSTVWEILQGK